MFAVVKIAGQQFKVQEGQELYVPHIEGKNGDKVEFGQDHQIEPAVVQQGVRAKRHTASGLSAVADRESDEKLIRRWLEQHEPAGKPNQPQRA